VILEAAGWAFCARLDLKEMKVTAHGHGVADREQQHFIRNVVLETQDLRMNAAFFQFHMRGCDLGVSYFMALMVGFSRGPLFFSAISDGSQTQHWRGGGVGRSLISLAFLFTSKTDIVTVHLRGSRCRVGRRHFWGCTSCPAI